VVRLSGGHGGRTALASIAVPLPGRGEAAAARACPKPHAFLRRLRGPGGGQLGGMFSMLLLAEADSSTVD